MKRHSQLQKTRKITLVFNFITDSIGKFDAGYYDAYFPVSSSKDKNLNQESDFVEGTTFWMQSHFHQITSLNCCHYHSVSFIFLSIQIDLFCLILLTTEQKEETEVFKSLMSSNSSAGTFRVFSETQISTKFTSSCIVFILFIYF
jgi:hypothetical protein